MRPPLTTVLAAPEATDWDDTGSILAGSEPVFDTITVTPSVLAALLDSLDSDGYLRNMCERFDFPDQFVLHDMSRPADEAP